VDRLILIVAESGDFSGAIKFLFEFKSRAHLTVRATGVFQGGEIFATTNQLIRPDANNRVGVMGVRQTGCRALAGQGVIGVSP
jgi:hypothetical protein